MNDAEKKITAERGSRFSKPELDPVKSIEAFNRGAASVPCRGGCDDGEFIINPEWPRGTEPYSEKCSICGGTGQDPDIPIEPGFSGCYVIELEDGVVARIHGEPTDDLKTQAAINAVIKAAVEYFK